MKNTADQAFQKLVEASIDYAEEYLRDAAVDDWSANRKHHRQIIESVSREGLAAERIFARK